MSINLASKYSGKIAEVFTLGSYLVGKTSTAYDFIGVNSVKIYTPTTIAFGDYSRTATSSRFGTLTEMQDTIQELALSQDKSVNIAIDAANNDEQMMVKNAGKMLQLETNEQLVPMVDKYAFNKIVQNAGTIDTIAAAPTKSTIVAAILDGVQSLDDAGVPADGRYIFITGYAYKFLLQAAEFLALDSIGSKAYTKGVVGEISGIPVIKVPTSYIPTNCYFAIWHNSAVVMPLRPKTARILTESENIDGAILQLHYRYDAFVLGARATGVYACVLAANQCAAPTNVYENTGDTVTVTSSAATSIYYTTDGSDPRYSPTRTLIASGATFVISASCTVKSVAYKTTTGYFTSDVTTTVVTFS